MKANFFSAEKASKRITRIFSVTGEIIYLVEGDCRAALIDTGCGLGDLRAFVNTLTSLPLTVFITHAHPDHIRGCSLFADCDIFLSELDNGLMNDPNADVARLNYISRSVDARDYTEADIVPIGGYSVKPLHDGDCFDLGSISLKAFAIPGHSPGSTAFLIPEERVLVTGDGCALCTLLFLGNTTVEDYLETLGRLTDLTRGQYDRVFISHRNGETPGDMVEQVMAVCREVIAGTDDKMPYTIPPIRPGDKAFFAKKVDKNRNRVDGKLANLAYSPEKVLRKGAQK